ncbi:hypothetical protein NJBCHELONAE_31240 [Mycobacteroides chelonae]|uniref:hypothetical protein n=1 Tax=Mycobacteroides chelonae TaxID=1774 RepID=UPI0021DD71DF|nr:hypothetical protein [Mycobacteroides chelonae]GLE57815.1 hypothetical protein NJBCHELONAE_31240 [Mycobacteroides chelonae]
MTWVWIAATLATTWFLIMVLVLGATVFRHRSWGWAFYFLGCSEVERRGFNDRKGSSDQQHAIDMMVGPVPTSLDISVGPLNGLVLRAFQIFSGYAEARTLVADIEDKRRTLLSDMLDRQLQRAGRFRSIRWASRAWVIQRRISRIEVAVRGIIWLLRRSLNEVTTIVKEYSTKLGVVAVFVSSPYWLIVRKQDGSGLSAPDALGFLTKLVLPGLVLWAMGLLMSRMLVGHAGLPKSWPRQSVVKVVLVVLFSVLIGGAGDFMSRQVGELKWLERVGPAEPQTSPIVMTFFLVGILWLGYKAGRHMLDRNLLMSARVRGLAASAVAAAISVPIAGLIAVGAVPQPMRTAMFGMLIVGALLGLVSGTYGIREWFDRYRTLVRAGVEIPRWGFSWYLVGAWACSLVLVFILEAIPAAARNPGVQLVLMAPAAFGLLGALTVLPITVLFVRRVNTRFEQRMTITRRARTFTQTRLP